MKMDSHEFSRNQKIVTDGFMISRSVHRTEKLFSMGFEILGLETQIFRKKILYTDIPLKTPYRL